MNFSDTLYTLVLPCPLKTSNFTVPSTLSTAISKHLRVNWPSGENQKPLYTWSDSLSRSVCLILYTSLSKQNTSRSVWAWCRIVTPGVSYIPRDYKMMLSNHCWLSFRLFAAPSNLEIGSQQCQFGLLHVLPLFHLKLLEYLMGYYTWHRHQFLRELECLFGIESPTFKQI